MSKATGTRNAESGVAFILVLTVLVGLLVLAAPFLTVAMNDHAVSESVIAEGQAEAGTDAVLRYGRWWLERTTDFGEARKGGDPASDIFSTRDWDVPEEFDVPIDLAGDRGGLLTGSDGAVLFSRKDPRGITWDLKVRDEQSIPNIWSSPPFLTAASLGRTVHTIDLKPDDTEIDLEDGKDFPEKNGAIWIDGERITYATREGGKLLGCTRGTPGGGRQRAHKAETYVLDDRARELAMLPFKSPRAKGRWREPLDVSATKELSLYGESGTLSPLEVDKLAREFTTTSWRITGDPFGPSTVLRQPIDPATADLTDGFRIRVKSNDGINAGTLVRITDGVNTEYGFVVASRRQGTSATLTLAEVTQNAYAERRTAIAPLIRHPVNINTASKDTLKRVLTGLQVTAGQRNVGKNGRVTVLSAELVADKILEDRPIKDLEQFRDLLQSVADTAPLVFDQFQMVAIFRNAVDAGDWTLGQSTVSFVFKSSDFFTLKASAVVSDPAGAQRAVRHVTERVRVASPGRLVVRLDTQEDFENAIVRARNSLYTTTHPNPVERVNPMSESEIPASRIPRMLLAVTASGTKDKNDPNAETPKGIFANKNEGDVRLWPARMEGLGGFTEHFDGRAFQVPDNVDPTKIDPEGWILENGAYHLPLQDAGQRGGGGNRAGGGRGQFGGGGGRGGRSQRGGQAGSILGRSGPNPVKIDMWVRPETFGGQQTLYDLQGGDPDQRITLSIEPSGLLKVRMRDRTIDNPGDQIEEACETTFTPPGGLWKNETWYHLGASMRGCKPEELSLWLDGHKRGEAKFQSILTSSMSDQDTSFSVERADDWPQRGVCWIGREAVEFERTGNSFNVLTYPPLIPGASVITPWNGRGKRGTPACPHGAGEVVQLFGYSTLCRSQGDRGGLAIPRGGANLASSLGPWMLASFEGNDTVNLPALPGLPPVQFTVLDPGKSGGDQLKLRPCAGSADRFDSSFQTTGGYIVMMGLAPMTQAPNQTNLAFVSELAYYSSYTPGGATGGTLNGVQAVPNPPNPDLGGSNQISTQQNILYLKVGPHNVPAPPGVPYFCAVFPISVGVTSTTGYLTPKTVQGATQITPEHISLGEPDYDSISNHKIEWIRYYHVDTSKKQLLCDDLNRLVDATQAVEAVLRSQNNTNQQFSIPMVIARDFLQMRGQHRTDIFGYTKTASGQQVHQTNEDVTPVFGVVQYPGIGFIPPTQANQQPTPVPGQPSTGWGDSVTLETANATVRKRFDVTWSQNGLCSVGESPGQDFSQRAISNGAQGDRDQYLRLLKFPSGEMPRIGRPGAKGRAGGDIEGGTMVGRLDEIRVAPFQSDRFIVWDHAAMGLNASQVTASSGPANIQGINETANEIPVANLHWYMYPLVAYNNPNQVILPDGRGVEWDAELTGFPNNDAGLVQIDDEIIAFRRVGRGGKGGPAILDCERGVFNTTPQKHGYGANVVFLDFLPVTMLSEAISPTASLLNVASEQNFATTGGLVMIDRELIHYTEIRGRSFAMPPILDDKGEETGGLFRGRFGTTAARHDNEALVIELPFRYWDRWAESQDNPEISFYQFAINRPGAWFDRFGYEERRPTQNVQIVTLVRTEQDVPWCTDPSRASPNLYRFENGLQQDKSLLSIGRHGTALEARFYVRWLGNSFDPITLTQHDWKTTPELRWAEVQYFDETQVLYRETDK